MSNQTNNPINIKINQMMTLTDVLDQISETVKINIDNKQTEEVSAYKNSPEVVFDSNSYNFHIFPIDQEKRKQISREFADVRDCICKKMNEIFSNEQIDFAFNFVLAKKKVNDYYYQGEVRGNGSRGNMLALERIEGNNAKDGNGIYKYIEITKEKKSYTINFMRYICDAKGIVGCTMRAIQFHKDTGKINKGDSGFEICYPETDKDFDFNINSNGNICYNPPVDWPRVDEETGQYDNNDIDEIIGRFLDFIDNSEGDDFYTNPKRYQKGFGKDYLQKHNNIEEF